MMLLQALSRTRRFQRHELIFLRPVRYYTADLGQVLGPRRAIVYKHNGDPSQVLYATTNSQPVPLGAGQVLIRFLMAPINPADLNTIEGTYPSKPMVTPGFDETAGDVFIAGNEGVAEVIKAGPSDKHTGQHKFKEGDWVVMRKPQSGTWTNWKVADAVDLMPVPKRHTESKVTEVFGATMMVNALTALGLVTEIGRIEPQHYLLQNGANSGVGQAVIQVAKKLRIRTVNFVRDRPDFEAVASYLTAIGGTHVFPYSRLLDRSFKREFTGFRQADFPAKHAFDGIGGATATAMAALLDPDGHLVSYGGMSRQGLKIPVSLQIFNGLTCHGYWHSKVWNNLSQDEQTRWMARLTSWKESGEFQDPAHEVIALTGDDGAVQDKVRGALDRLNEGMVGKKLLLKWDEP